MKAVLLAVLVLRVTPTADAFRQSAMATLWSSEKQASCCSLQAQHMYSIRAAHNMHCVLRLRAPARFRVDRRLHQHAGGLC